MKAVCWYGKNDVRVETVPEPRIINPRDAIVKVSSTVICGSDLHLYDGYIPTMQQGDIVGHEFMGQVVEVGPAVDNLTAGERVAVPFTIACGGCFYYKLNFGAAFGKGLTLKMGQTHVHKYLRPLLERIQRGEIDPSFIIAHRLRLDEAPQGYATFKHREDGCVKVVMTP
ncbi:MAG: alcohol dehydrogenase catalytic domain-containing protein [Chloroflexota bacterium]